MGSKPLDMKSFDDGRGRSSRRKPTKTHKVAANFDDVDHYYDYVPGGIPDGLLEGIAGTESRGHVARESAVDNDLVAADQEAHCRSPVYAGKRRGRPPGRGQGRGQAPIVITPQPGGTKRKGRPPKTQTPARVQTPTRVQPSRVTPQSPPNCGPAGHNTMPYNQPAASPLHFPNGAGLRHLPVTEYNVWPVLEKLLAATQSMGMLLGSLKDDLKRTSAMIATVSTGQPELEQARKRREVATKLWRAFVAYKKSFDEIESFTRNTGTGVPPVVGPISSVPAVSPQVVVSPAAAAARSPAKAHVSTVPRQQAPAARGRSPRNSQPSVVIELSDSDDETALPKKKPYKSDNQFSAATSFPPGKPENGSGNRLMEQKTVNEDLHRAVGNQGQISSVQASRFKSNVNAAVNLSNANSHLVATDLTTGVGKSRQSDNDDSTSAVDEREKLIEITPAAEVNIDEVAAAAAAQMNRSVERDAVCSDSASSVKVEPKQETGAKSELFGSLRFEPLFDIQPLDGAKS